MGVVIERQTLDALLEIAEDVAQLECVGPHDACNHCLAEDALLAAEREGLLG